MNKKINTDYVYSFSVEADGLYSITATHFHSFKDKVDIVKFEKNIVPKGKFIRKIDDMYFYWSPN